MKKTTIALLMLFALVSCNKQNSNRDIETIESAVLKNAPGNKEDYKFTVLDLKELGVITVADSVTLLGAEFEANKASELQNAVSVLELTKKLQAISNKDRFATAKEKEDLTRQVREQEQTIDSLKALTVPTVWDEYVSRDDKEVLVRVMRCLYTTTHPKNKQVIEEHFDFFLSPDGSECYKKIKVK